uniref:ATP-dependent DNA helicase PIF1 n=1 Tax=Neogobius melanostomus TaxID=47308 RepID=A0A8C6TDJ2_9GOBI
MMSSEDGAQVQCSITVEQLNTSGETTRRQVMRKASILLGRNEFQELILRVHDGKVPQSFAIKEFKLFTKFARDGKCTIRLLPSNTQILLSNCPPAQLSVFLKTLTIKHQAGQGAKPMTDREKLKAGLPRSFEAISPLQQKDIQKVNELRARAHAPNAGISDRTNKNKAGAGQQVKRSRADCNFSPVKANPNKKPILSLPTCRLNKEQTAVLSAVLSGRNVFFTGSAGTGKSFLLKRIIGSLPPKSTYATASTGVAACHIGGTTLHSFAGQDGSGSAPLAQCIELAQRPGILQHWTSCRHLIIDEVSMVEAHYFDKLESVARSVRRSTEPFGGIQLIVCGDFLQLPPVSKGKEKASFCFQSRSWRKVIQLNMELTEVRRQTDQSFITLLQAVRVGRVTEEVSGKLLHSAYHKIERDGILATRLCTHKDDVELTNQNKLQQLPGAACVFEALDSDPALEKTIDAHSPVGRVLQLKVGAQVMLTKNLDVARGLVNGARGVVVSFETTEKHGYPRVRFLCGVTEVMKPERWVFKSGGGLHLSRQQLPLKLAWAISIHKSQGMTLDCVEISLARVFESGQAYVALSRARSLEGLRVMDFDPRVVRADPDVLQFYRRMRKERLLLQVSVKRKGLCF